MSSFIRKYVLSKCEKMSKNVEKTKIPIDMYIICKFTVEKRGDVLIE
jgi:hypothetical protein